MGVADHFFDALDPGIFKKFEGCWTDRGVSLETAEEEVLAEIGDLFWRWESRKMGCCDVVHDLYVRLYFSWGYTAHSLSRLAQGLRPVAISRIQHPRDQMSSAPCRPLSEPVMTIIRITQKKSYLQATCTLVFQSYY